MDCGITRVSPHKFNTAQPKVLYDSPMVRCNPRLGGSVVVVGDKGLGSGGHAGGG